jgi:hypothetical protein
LIGARAAQIGLGETAAAIEGVGRAEQKQGIFARQASERTWLHNQALFTLRRYAYMGTLALTALIGESLRWGYQFNQTMASSRAALGPVFNDTKALNEELVSLYNFTKRTPFQFKDMTTAFRQMYGAFHPLGIDVETTNKTLYSLVNALSFAGRTTPGALNRVAVALQHMAFMGHLTGQTVIQLARDGLPIFPVLQKELGLTADQLHRVGALGIPTIDVLNALNKYISETPGYMNAAARQAQTFGGSLTTLKDNIAQLTGGLIFGAYSRGPSFIQNVNKTFDLIGEQIKKNAAAGRGQSISWDQATKIFETRYPVLVNFFRILDLIFSAVKSLGGIIFNSLIPALRVSAYALAPVLVLFVLVDKVLQFLAQHGWILATVLTVFITRWIILKQIMFLNWLMFLRMNLALDWFAFKMTVSTAWTERFTAAEIQSMIASGYMSKALGAQVFMIGRLSAALEFATGLWEALTIGSVRGANGQFRAMTSLEKIARSVRIAFIDAGGGIMGFAAALRVAGAAFLTFLAEVPIVGWIALAIIGLTLLYFKWNWFRTFVNAFATEFAHRIMMVVRSFAPLITVLKDVYNWMGKIIGRFKPLTDAAHKVGGFFSGILGHLGIGGISPSKAGKFGADAFFNYLFPVAGLAQLAGKAAGGPITSSGSYLVGERGPEVVSLPGGSYVTPNNALSMPMINVTIPVKIDGKKLGEANAKIRLDAAARA